MKRSFKTLVIASVLCFHATATAGETSQAGGQLSYERDVRPILKAHCFHCHGEEGEPQGDLDVRLQRLIVAGGESGTALVPGNAEESLLLSRIVDGDMPPEEVKLRPSAAEIDTIRRWIASGAKTLHPEPEKIVGHYFTEEERNFWAFRAVVRPALPVVKNLDQVRTPIDAFLLAELEKKNLSFSTTADRRSLLRRVYVDLTGLPPTPEQAQAFLTDQRTDAYERLIDQLLNSPHYGERWGRHWLDVAGYADSEGYDANDTVRPDAYKYRDWVIRALNADMPLDQFIQEQLAGDEMVPQPYKNLTPDQIDKLVATGYLRMAADGTGSSGVDQTIARNQVVADTIQIVTTSLLGLTVGCAQCHDHRYDPIPQEDYYKLRAVFEPAYDWKKWRTPAQRRLSLYNDADRAAAAKVEAEAKKIDVVRLKKQKQYIEQTFERQLAKLSEAIREPIRKARGTPVAKRTPAQKKLLKDNPSTNVTSGSLYLYDRKAADDLKKMTAQATKVRSTKPKQQYVRLLSEPAGATLPDTFLFNRGDPEQPKGKLNPSELTILTSIKKVELPVNETKLGTTGRRLAYARWLTNGTHPLTGRVMVNRVWSHYFGRGIVDTPGDFGFLGARPSHPALLDWLADELVRKDWSLKQLHKTILLSSAYRQSSTRREEGDAVDPDNQLYWRMPVRRLDAETVRDHVLAVSGKMIHKQFGPPVPVMADRVGQFVIGKENLNAGRPGAVLPMSGEQFRRSVYVQSRRSRPLGVLDTFDLPVMTPNCTSRKSSTVAPQSLMMMNSQFTSLQSLHLARRARREAGKDLKAQVTRVWQLIYATTPAPQELNEAVAYVVAQTKQFNIKPAKTAVADLADQETTKIKQPPGPNLEALASLCHALLSSNEFLYID